jgi:hypothetical protein
MRIESVESIEGRADDGRTRRRIELPAGGGRRPAMIAVVQDGLGLAGTHHQLEQRAAYRVADLEAVDLIVAIEVEVRARVDRVIGEAHAVGRQESAGTNPEASVDLI